MELMDRLQPSNSPTGTDPELHSLFLLHKLDIWDKHRRLNVMGGLVQVSALKSGGNEPGPFGGPGTRHVFITDGTPLLRLRRGQPTPPNVNFDQGFDVGVAFEKDGPAKGQLVLQTLVRLIWFVDEAITLFAPLFEPSSDDESIETGWLPPSVTTFPSQFADPANPTADELRAIGLDPDFEIRPPGAPPRFPEKPAP
jgi:hypothetical protein